MTYVPPLSQASLAFAPGMHSPPVLKDWGSLQRLLDLIRRSIRDKEHSLAFCGIMLGVIIMVNVYQSQIGVFNGPNADYTGMSLIMRSFQKANATTKPIVLILSPSLSINTYTWLLPTMNQAYGLSHTQYTIIHPANFSCTQQVKNATILVLQQDHNALQKIQKSNCGYSLSYTVLSPVIPFF